MTHHCKLLTSIAALLVAAPISAQQTEIQPPTEVIITETTVIAIGRIADQMEARINEAIDIEGTEQACLAQAPMESADSDVVRMGCSVDRLVAQSSTLTGFHQDVQQAARLLAAAERETRDAAREAEAEAARAGRVLAGAEAQMAAITASILEEFATLTPVTLPSLSEEDAELADLLVERMNYAHLDLVEATTLNQFAAVKSDHYLMWADYYEARAGQYADLGQDVEYQIARTNSAILVVLVMIIGVGIVQRLMAPENPEAIRDDEVTDQLRSRFQRAADGLRTVVQPESSATPAPLPPTGDEPENKP